MSSSTDGFIDNSYIATTTLFTNTALLGSPTVGGLPIYRLIGFVTAPAAAASVSVSFATSSTLKVYISYVQTDNNADKINFNSDTGTNYGYHLFNNNLVNQSASSSAATKIALPGSGGSHKDAFNLDIENSSTTAPKQYTIQGMGLWGNQINVHYGAGTWYGTTTSQITTITVAPDGGGQIASTTIAVYGLTNY